MLNITVSSLEIKRSCLISTPVFNEDGAAVPSRKVTRRGGDCYLFQVATETKDAQGKSVIVNGEFPIYRRDCWEHLETLPFIKQMPATTSRSLAMGRFGVSRQMVSPDRPREAYAAIFLNGMLPFEIKQEALQEAIGLWNPDVFMDTYAGNDGDSPRYKMKRTIVRAILQNSGIDPERCNEMSLLGDRDILNQFELHYVVNPL